MPIFALVFTAGLIVGFLFERWRAFFQQPIGQPTVEPSVPEPQPEPVPVAVVEPIAPKPVATPEPVIEPVPAPDHRGLIGLLVLALSWTWSHRAPESVAEPLPPVEPEPEAVVVVELVPEPPVDHRWQLMLGEDSVQRVSVEKPPRTVVKPHGKGQATTYRLLGAHERIAYYEACR